MVSSLMNVANLTFFYKSLSSVMLDEFGRWYTLCLKVKFGV